MPEIKSLRRILYCILYSIIAYRLDGPEFGSKPTNRTHGQANYQINHCPCQIAMVLVTRQNVLDFRAEPENDIYNKIKFS